MSEDQIEINAQARERSRAVSILAMFEGRQRDFAVARKCVADGLSIEAARAVIGGRDEARAAQDSKGHDAIASQEIAASWARAFDSAGDSAKADL